MKRIFIISMSLLVICIWVPSKANANSYGEGLVWATEQHRAEFWFGKNNGFNHVDAKNKIKWYIWDLEENYYLSLRKPFALRPAQVVKVLDLKSKCTSIPIKVRRELSSKDASDSLNATTIQFFQVKLGIDKVTPTQIISRPVIYSIEPASWSANTVAEQDFHVPICEESIGGPISGLLSNQITLNYRFTYSTPVKENLVSIDPKCDEILNNLCMFYSNISRVPGIKFTESEINSEVLKEAYEEKIASEREYLQAKPCEIPYASYSQQSNSNVLITDNKARCDSSLRNLEFLTNEIAKATKKNAATPTPVASPKKVAITCIKGKKVKQVSGINAKCQKGYSKIR